MSRACFCKSKATGLVDQLTRLTDWHEYVAEATRTYTGPELRMRLLEHKLLYHRRTPSSSIFRPGQHDFSLRYMSVACDSPKWHVSYQAHALTASCACCPASSAGARLPFAGPITQIPSLLNRLPWTGQSQLFSVRFQHTTPFKCGHRAENL